MSAAGLRTLLCCIVSMIGAWTIAAGFLTHHPVVAILGLILASASIIVMYSSPKGDEQ